MTIAFDSEPQNVLAAAGMVIVCPFRMKVSPTPVTLTQSVVGLDVELLNHVDQIIGAPVMQEEQSLACSPQRRGAELVRSRSALSYAIRQFGAHVVQREIRERSKRGVVEISEDGWVQW